MVLNTGERRVRSGNRLLTTPAYRIGGRTTYALEGSIFNAGTTVKWLRDELKLIRDAAENETQARRLAATGGAQVVPGFTGLGATDWEAAAHSAHVGSTHHSGAAPTAK